MRTIPLSRIKIGERQRKVINKEKLKELGASISSKGLLHPIVLRAIDKGEGEQTHELIAGERRYRTMLMLHEQNTPFTCDGTVVPKDEAPYTLNTESATISLLEMELEENTHREDLTWQERVAALDELHTLRQATNAKHTQVDTVRELTRSKPEDFAATQKHLQQARLIAPFMDDPAISGAKNVSTAAKLVGRKIEQELNRALFKTAAPVISKHRLFHDSLFNMKLMWEQKQLPLVDVIVADPPYGVNADSFGDAANQTHNYDDTEATALAAAEAIFFQAQFVTNPNAHIYMFCDIDLFCKLKTIAKNAGWAPFRTPLIWNKIGQAAHAPLGEYGFRRRSEYLLFASKGKMPFSTLCDDIIDCPPVREKEHAAQKPFELYKKLLGLSAIPGMTVLDPCCGSGPIFTAAESLNLTAIGIEQDEPSFKIAQDTLRAATAGGPAETLAGDDDDEDDEDELASTGITEQSLSSF